MNLLNRVWTAGMQLLCEYPVEATSPPRVAMHGSPDVTCRCDVCVLAGTVLRAPTANNGLAPHCKDTFFGKARLRIWRVNASGSSGGGWGGSSGSSGRLDGPLPAGLPLYDGSSDTAALEVGGGPWWAAWRAKAAMLEPFRSLVQLPIDAGALSRAIPDLLKPPGL